MSTQRWEREDLVRRVLLALRCTKLAVRLVAQDSHGAAASDRLPVGIRSEVRPLVRAKVVGESTLLIRAVGPLADLDHRVAVALDGLARLVEPLARDRDVRTAVCLEPGRALEHAFAHVLLRDAGFPDASFDALLGHCLDAPGAPERLPTRHLEQQWLRRIWTGEHDADDAALVGRSGLGLPLDALAATAQDHYAFTHVVLYTGDVGRGRVRLPRSADDICADAETALAASLDADNHDLTAELLWTWPMLGLPWTPAAVFALSVLTAVMDDHGFLPGPAFRAHDRDQLPTELRDEYVLRSSYHTTLVMGMLGAAALLRGRRPPDAVPISAGHDTPADATYRLLGERPRPVGRARWQQVYETLDPARRDALGSLVVAVALRRARSAADLAFVRETLTVALRHGLVDAPAPRQAVGLLRRTAALSQAWAISGGDVCRLGYDDAEHVGDRSEPGPLQGARRDGRAVRAG